MKNKEVKEFIKIVNEQFSLTLNKKDRYEKQNNLILVNNEPLFFYFENRLVPTLKLLFEQDVLKKITVDMGAVKFVVKGADVMRPGITNIEENIEKNELIVIIDETHSKKLAVGIAIFSTVEMTSLDSGKVIKNLHYVGDEIWNSNI